VVVGCGRVWVVSLRASGLVLLGGMGDGVFGNGGRGAARGVGERRPGGGLWMMSGNQRVRRLAGGWLGFQGFFDGNFGGDLGLGFFVA
jgi:hypothetical protein